MPKNIERRLKLADIYA